MNKETAKLIIDEYTLAEFPMKIFNPSLLLNFFKKQPYKYFEEDKDDFNELPNIVYVWRGECYNKHNDNIRPMSWTTNKKVAKFFALRFRNIKKHWTLTKSSINKKDILFYTNARSESEVILDPKNLHMQSTIAGTHEPNCKRVSCKCGFDSSNIRKLERFK
tara:strand:- start:411 stop:896 length:486 start_codon:yes stop_codon:yes gene_type:complete